MNPALLVEIARLALGVAVSQTDGNIQRDACVTDTLLKIIQKSAEAYRAHTGEPVDPTLIKVEDPI